MLVALLVPLLAGCQVTREAGSSANARGAAEPVESRPAPSTAAPIQLPDLPLACDATESSCTKSPLESDDWPHDVLTEWWYYTGHLRTDEGQRFGFQFVIFQTIRGANPIGYLSHFAITDEASGRFAYDARAAQRTRIPASLDLDVGGWTLSGSGGDDRLGASMEDYALDLALVSDKPPALHGGEFISFGDAGDSYYFSRTRMAASGRLRRGDSWTEVTGQAWHDHQWGNFIVPAVGGWDWISLQLDHNRELMLTVLRNADGSPAGAFGTFVDADGKVVDVPGEAIGIEPTGSWTSPQTGATYPSGWRVTVTQSTAIPGASLTLSPVLADQELSFERLPYWEGAVDVSGTVDGQDATGQGYVELTGYRP